MANDRKVQIEILLYYYRNGILHVLLNKFGNMSALGVNHTEAREGFYRPTIIGNGPNSYFGSIVAMCKRELGGVVERALPPMIRSLVPIRHPSIKRFVTIVDEVFVKSVFVPYYSGGLTLISGVQALDIIEIPLQSDAHMGINRYPMPLGTGWKGFLEQGFEIAGNIPKSDFDVAHLAHC